MDNNESNDWKKIAHDEFENRKRIELQLARTNAAFEEAKQGKHAISSYYAVLEKQCKDLEHKNAELQSIQQQTVAMLKKAQQLIIQRKQELCQLQADNAGLQISLHDKSKLLATVMHDHEQTNRKLATALKRLANSQPALVAPVVPAIAPQPLIPFDEIIYTEAELNNQQLDEFFQQLIITANQG